MPARTPTAARPQPTSAAARRARAARRRHPRLSRLLAWLLSAVLGHAGLAYAQVPVNTLPTGGQVVTGQAQLQQSNNLLVVNQATPRLGIDWQSFSIGSGATVEFRQPGRDSVALNRVVGNSGSEIYGQLRSNGQVFLVNPNGVLFAPGAKVDVGGLVASTLDISQSDFAAGRYSFAGAGSGAVVNQGSLRATAGGYVALFGPSVDNQGEITVEGGSVVLASGRAATVSISGNGLISAVVGGGAGGSVANSGSIQADGGLVTLDARSAEGLAASLVNNSGIVRANTLVEKNGEIWITGDQVASSGSLSADATGSADAGRVTVKGGMADGSLALSGRISAQAEGGRGGQVETSAARVAIAPETRVTTLSGSGLHGTWTIDPTDFTVSAGSGAATTSGIGADTLSTNLDAGNVVLATAASGSEPGDIFVNAAVSWSGATTLTLNASRNVNINAGITASSVGAGLVITPGTGGSYTLGAGQRIRFTGSQNSLTIAGNSYQMVRTLAQLQGINASTTTRAGNWALADDLDATATSAAVNPTLFTPIGSNTNFNSNLSFRGRFDGLGNSIVGLTVNQPATAAVGLFGVVHDATIRNVNFNGGAFTGSQYVGALAGYVGSNTTQQGVMTITNVTGNAPVSQTGTSGNGQVGGLVGQFTATGGLVSRSSSSGAVSTADSNANAGGLVGYLSSGSIASSSASGNVTSSNSANSRSMGGLVGYFDGTGTLSDSQASGNVNAAFNAGGLVGFYGSSGAVTNVSASGSVTGTASGYAGGLIGDWNTAGAISTASATGAVSGSQYVGGLIGRNINSGSLSGGTTATSSTVTSTYTSTAYVGGLVGSFSSSVAGAQVSGSSAAGNVTYNGPTGNVGGLVGYVSGGSIASSSASGTVQANSATDSRSVGGLVGAFDGTGSMTNVSATGAVAGGYNAGGLAGYYSGTGPITTATASGNVSGTQYVGGLIGQWYFGGAITGAQASGAVTATQYAGGLIGYGYGSGDLGAAGTAGAVRATGNVTGGPYVGGLAGYLFSANITNASAIGTVTSTTTSSTSVYAGGLVGYYTQSGSNRSVSNTSATGSVTTASGYGEMGGLFGGLRGASLSNSTASGAVSAPSNINSRSVGGLVGYFDGGGAMSNVGATGSVDGGTYVGGLVGYYGSSGNLNLATATGNVTGSSYVGGLLGYMPTAGSISNSQADGNVSTQYDGGGLVGHANGTTGISDSRATGNVTGPNNAASLGGLVGYGYNIGTLNNVRADGNVTGGTRAGGLAGYLLYTNVNLAVANGRVNVVSDGTGYAGGLVGDFYNYNTVATITGSTATGAVFLDAPAGYAGGLVGYAQGGTGLEIGTSSASGQVTAQDSASSGSSHYAGGLVGIFTGGRIYDSNATGDVTGRYMAGGLVGQYYGSRQSSNVSASGDVSGFSYVGGLFGYADNAYLVTATASGDVRASATGSAYVGGLIGYAFNSGNTASSGMSDLSASGAVDAGPNAGSYAGGLIGYLQDYTNATSTLPVLANSSATGSVRGSGTSGGLVGYYYTAYTLNNRGLRSSWASGTVEGGQFVGGLVGVFYGYGGIQDSWASGNVTGIGNTGDKYLGGLVGQFNNYSSTAGSGQILRSFASGNVALDAALTLSSSSDIYAGGLVGLNSSNGGAAFVSIADSYATGSVTLNNATGRMRAGGLLGYTDGSVTRVYASGAASATGISGSNNRFIGGLVAQRGSTSNTAASSFWDTTRSGNSTSVIGSGVTTTELRTASTFSGWDLASSGGSTQAWRIYDGQTAPLIRSLLTPLSLNLANINKVYDGTTALGSAAISVGGTAVANPGRIFVAGVSPNAGSYNLTAGNLYSQQNGYDLSLSGTATLTVAQRTLSIDGLVADKVYDATTTATLNANPRFTGLVAGESLTFQPGSGFAATFDTKTVGASKPVTLSGSYTLGDGPGGLASNYVLPTAGTTTAAITPATLTAGSFAATNRAYDGSTVVAVSATAATLSGVLGNDAVSVDLSAVTSGSIADKNVGTGKAVTVQGAAITGSDAANYRLAGIDAVTVDITPRLLTLNGITASDRQYNSGVNVSLVSSGAALSGMVSGDLVSPKLNSLQGTVANKNVGNAKPVTITGLGLRGADAANYSVQAGSVAVNISPYQLTVYLGTTNATNRVYDGTTNAATYWPTYWYGNDDIVVNATSIGYVDKNVAYNSSNQVISKNIVASGLTLGGNDAGNYTLLNSSATTTGVISPKPLSVSGVTASNRVYDGTRDVNVTISGATVDTSAVVSGDQVSVATPSSGSVVGQMANKNAGTNKAVTVPGLTLTGTDAGNYTISSGAGGVTVDITPKPLTAIYTAQDKVYDFSVIAPMTVTSNDVIAGDTIYYYADSNYCGCGYAVFTTSGRDVNGNYTTTRNAGNALPVVITNNFIDGPDRGNYTLLNPTGSSVANITPKPVTLAFSGVTRVYDGTDAATVTLNRGASGVYSQDVLSTTQTAVYTGSGAKNVGTNKPISVSGISLSGANAGNYTVANTTATTTGQVTAKPVTISGITATDRAYDGTTVVALTAGTLGSAGFVSGDVVSVSPPTNGITTGTIANKNIGTNKPVTVTGLTITGADAGNYLIDPAGSGITVNISAAALTPSFVGVSRVYNGGTTASVTSTTTGIASGDVVTFTSLANFTGTGARDVGTNKPISVTNIGISGSGAGNYTLASTTATAFGDITPKPVTASYTGSTRVYNGASDLSAAVVGSSLQFVAGDAVGLAQTALFADGNAGSNKAVSITGISLTGAQAGNYTLSNSTASTTATITPKPLGVTGVTATSRVYDGTTTVAVNLNNATVDTSAVIAGDQVSFSLPPAGITTGTLSDRNAGAAKPVSITGIALTGSSAANYSLLGATGLTVNITPRALTASYAAANKVYDGTADATVTASSADVLSIDASTLGFNAQGVFAAGKNVGTGLQVAVSGTFLTGASRDNYALVNPSGNTTASITPRTVTALFGGTTRVYDGTDAATVTSTLQGRVGGDQLGTTQTAVFTGTGARNVGNGKAVAVSNAALSGADAGNYVLANTSGTTTGSITPKPITVSGLNNVTATDRVYDGTTTVAVVVPSNVTLTPVSSDILVGDVVTIEVPTSGITTGTMANKNAGNDKAVTVSGLTLGGTDAGNYSIAGTSGVRVNIAPLAITATYAGVNRVYNGGTLASVSGSSTGIVAGDVLLIQGSGTFTDGKNVGTAKPIAVNTASLAGTDAGNYTLLNTTGSASADVTPLAITATFTGGSRVYDGSTAAPASGTSSAFVAGDSVSVAGTATFSGPTGTARNVGSNKPVAVSGITLAGSDAANYSLTSTSASTTASITPRPLTLLGLTGVTANDRAYDGSTTVAVTVSGSGTVTLDTSNVVAGDTVGVAQLSGNLTTGTMLDKNVGSNKAVAVTGLALTGADAGNYVVAATQGVTVNITPRNLTATFTGLDKVYDGTTAATLLGTSADIVAGDVVSIGGSGVFGSKNAGTGVAIAVTGGTLSGSDAFNYLLVNPSGAATANITPRTVTASFVGGTRVYDGGTAAPVTGSASGFISGDNVALAQTASFADKNVGTNKAVAVSGITLTGSDAGNYTVGNSSASTTASITPKPLGVVGLTGVTAADRAYDGTVAVVVTVGSTGTVSVNPADLVAGDVVSINAPSSGVTTGTLLDKNVGSNKPVAVAGLTLGGADAGNYSVASTSGVTVNITPKNLTASFTGQNKVYDGTNAAVLVGTSSDIVAGDLVGFNVSGTFTAGKNVGTGLAISYSNATLTSADAANYLLMNPSGSASADITPRTLSASFTGGTRVYDGGTSAPVTGSTTGVIAGDVVTLSQTANFSGPGAKNVGTGKAVEVTGMALSGSDAGNYQLAGTTATTTASITPRNLNVSGITGITAQDRVYDGSTVVALTVSGNTGTLSGDALPGDDVIVNIPGSGLGSSGQMVDKHVGQNKSVAVSGLVLTGADAANYLITGTAGVTVNITPRDVVVAGVTAIDRVYDGSTLVAVDTSAGTLSGALAGDDLRLLTSGATATVSDKNAGQNKAVNLGGLTMGGSDARNYRVVGNGSSGLTVNIAPRTLNATLAVADKTYDGTTGASVTLADDRIAGDQLTLAAANAAFASRNAGPGIAVVVSGLGLAGADAGNYALAATSLTGSATINRAALNVTARTLTKTYGDTLALTGSEFSALGLVNNETLGQVALSTSGGGASAAAGTYAITAGNISGGTFDPANYNLTVQNGQLVVRPRPLTVAVNSVVRFADENNPGSFGFSTNVGGLVNGDAVTAVSLTVPAASVGAPGGSVFDLLPSSASVSPGSSAANYAISYTPGLLVVLPRPPRPGDLDTNPPPNDPGNGGVGVVVDNALRDRTLRAQADANTSNRQGIGEDNGLGLRRGEPPADTGVALSADELAALLSGDGRRITRPGLKKLPLINIDPQLKRLMSATTNTANTAPAP